MADTIIKHPITIYKRGTTEARCKHYLGSKDKAVYNLGKDDYISISLSSYDSIRFQIGDYIDMSETLNVGKPLSQSLATNLGHTSQSVYAYDGRLRSLLAKRYEIIDASTPNYNASTGAYDYTLKFVSYYMTWKRYVHKMPYIGSDGYRLGETDWSLTDLIERHILCVLANLKANGVTYFGSPLKAVVHIGSASKIRVEQGTDGMYQCIYEIVDGDDGTIDNKSKAVDYKNKTILAVIQGIASDWECDWWVDGDTIHFGRLEDTSTPIELSNTTDIKALSGSSSSGSFVTRLYALGSKKNLAANYRKDLVFTVSDDDARLSNVITDKLRPMQPKMFQKSRRREVATIGTPTGGTAHLADYASEGWNMSDCTYYASTHTLQKYTSWSVVFNEQRCTFSADIQSLTDRCHLDLSNLELGVIFESGTIEENGGIKMKIYGIKQDGTTKEIAKTDITRSNIKATKANTAKNIEISSGVGITQYFYKLGNFDDVADYYFDGAMEYVRFDIVLETKGTGLGKYTYVGGTISLGSMYKTVDTSVSFDGGTTWHTAALNRELNQDTSSAIILTLELTDGTTAEEGDTYMIKSDDLILGMVPSRYYQDDKSLVLKNSTSEVRLRLPEGTEYVDAIVGYDADGNAVTVDDGDVIEGVQIFDDIFPHRVDEVEETRMYPYVETVTDDVTGEEYQETWQAYQFVASEASKDFSADYELTNGDGIFVTFSSGSLNGMTFEVEWNPMHKGESKTPEVDAYGVRNADAKWFEIIRNEDYGTSLPNEVLYPKPGDKFTLYGYDASYMGQSITRQAEDDLLVRAKAYLTKAMHNDTTYSMTMYNSYFASKLSLFKPGKRVTLVTPNYFDAKRTERIIGYEVLLDIPYNEPKYTLGETAKYSRLSAIEEEIKTSK